MKRTVNGLGKRNWGNRGYAVLVLSATAAITLRAQTFTTLHSFDRADGGFPSAGLVQATNGNLYGTTREGGYTANGSAEGTIFKITPGGTLTTLYKFCLESGCTNGSWPYAGLVQATNGNFYGTTNQGGANGQGTVFKITPGGTLTTLYSLCSQTNCTDGADPEAGLVQAANGDLYGTTERGGSINNGGTVFRITPGGTLTTLYSFCSQSGCADGADPDGLVQDTNGDFYGTTSSGGANGYGTVFKIAPSGTLTTLYSFCTQSGCPDGANPYAGLVQANDGNLYGTTTFGGANAGGGYAGTVFRITPGGTLTTLYSFCSQTNCADGAGPFDGLVQDTNGDFYGTTYGGGTHDDGTVFRLSVELGPFVKTLPTSAKVGKAVKILGTDLTGATSVSFNGTAAVFTVVSSSLITTTVPAGATSGQVQVMTPSGTLSSNVPFRVLP